MKKFTFSFLLVLISFGLSAQNESEPNNRSYSLSADYLFLPKTYAMLFPIDNLVDEQKCYGWLVEFFHGGQLCCPGCGGADYHAHQNSRRPVIQYRCDICGAFFNIFTATGFKATKWACSRVVTVPGGFLKGESTNSIAKEHGLSCPNLLYLRHRLMENAHFKREATLLPDRVTESDEVFQNAGEKGIPHTDPDDPPRCRANKKKASALLRTTARPSTARWAGKAAWSGRKCPRG